MPEHLNLQIVLEMLDWFEAEKSYKEIAEHFNISVNSVDYHKRKYNITNGNKDRIRIARLKINAELKESGNFTKDQYANQAICIPTKFYFHCHDCQFTGSENNIDGIKDHLSRCEQLKVGVRVFDLTGNKVDA